MNQINIKENSNKGESIFLLRFWDGISNIPYGYTDNIDEAKEYSKASRENSYVKLYKIE